MGLVTGSHPLAVEAGLRAGELRSLIRSILHLEGDEPSVTIAAGYAKNRREDTLPLKPETAVALAKHLAGKMPRTQAFAVPARQHVAHVFRVDLADTGKAWIADGKTQKERVEREASDRLRYRRADGRKTWRSGGAVERAGLENR